MPSISIKTRTAIGVVCLAAAQHAAAFGGVGHLNDCASFTTCTAGLASGGAYFARRDVAATPGYPLGSDLVQGATVYQHFAQTQDSQAIDIKNFPTVLPPGPPVATSPWAVFARAQAQSDFGALHARAYSSRAAAGVDAIGNESAQIGQQTSASASAAWRDVWRFSAPGSFSATVSADGGSALEGFSVFPSSYSYGPQPLLADWYFGVRVWDVTNQTLSEYFELGGPTLVAEAYPRRSNEQRTSFNDSLVLNFNFVPDVQYVITAELRTTVWNGRTLNLLNTGRLSGATLGGGATMTTLSGHDYVTAVPEPDPRSLLLAGAVVMLVLARRRQPR